MQFDTPWNPFCFSEIDLVDIRPILETEAMQLLTNIFLLAQQLFASSALRVLDNGLGLPLYGPEDSIVDFALLAADQKATLPSQVQAFCFQYLEMLNI